ncbi:sporulation protein RMD1 [Verticillium dahliae VdLs.17]|uniref:Sporulation protein RMD1 n=1 Tax=Verticillium dahliae (strain VdLs.17 / ATCC MYA-4575 / FGSC 10137) TaxID=498257 RepID=G2XJ98_VERDV|nr:sporulation protein RMD1 [Verticillium dahliae VdLs.17]EGY20601.1 sporulation protein RMD1 [Verticillium dahliae VdLs.17]
MCRMSLSIFADCPGQAIPEPEISMDDQTTPSSGEASENTPLLPPATSPTSTRPKTARNVTFHQNPVSKTIEPEPAQPRPRHSHSFHLATASPGQSSAISSINNKLRRRNSHGSPSNTLPLPLPPKIGPQRSTKNAQKLKLLPNPEPGEEDEESGRDVYSQYTRIKDPTARRDAARLGKADRERLPRVTAYSTANKYEMEGLMRFMKGRGKSRGANPKLIDECLYSAYTYSHSVENRRDRRVGAQPNPVQAYERRHSTGDFSEGFERQGLLDLAAQGPQDSGFEEGFLHDGAHDIEAPIENSQDFDTEIHTPEVFLFEYGVVVIWGMTLDQEKRFLKEISKFETEKLAPDDVEAEFFNFYYTREYQARIYNDFITLRDKNNYMTKLAISHALAQSVKTSLFEELIASTVETCKDIPTQIANTGKIDLSRKQINMQIGELFILRINIHLNGSVLDTPELFWVEPQLEPVYQAVRSYLEMDQRVGLLTERLDVIADLLAVLKGELSHGHGEKLEWIVIVLIAAEIVVAAINIVVDLYAGE